jgi:hypothetical protein
MRFNQNDAMEFFQSLMEIISDDGKEVGQDNTIDKAMSGGKTVNYIICKDCQTESKNVEEWSMLPVPIPESIPTRKVGIEYLAFSLDS